MIKAIVAHDRNRLIGIDGKIPWHIPEDLKYFKNKTLNHMIVMGRKTAESINYKPLPGRINVILTTSKTPIDGFIICNSIKDVIHYYNIEFLKRQTSDFNLWVIGGEEVYRAFLPSCQEVYVTNVNNEFVLSEMTGKESRYFPILYQDQWDEEIVQKTDLCTYKKFTKKLELLGIE